MEQVINLALQISLEQESVEQSCTSKRSYSCDDCDLSITAEEGEDDGHGTQV